MDLRWLRNRVLNLVARGVVRAIREGKLQHVQLEVLADELVDDAERFQEYGFTAHPHPGAEAVVLFLGGNRSHPLVIAVDDRRYRLALERGEVALYDDQGQVVKLARAGIEITAVGDVTVEASGNVTVEAGGDATINAGGVVNLGGAGGMAVARVGDLDGDGEAIQTGSTKVFAA